jgi:hypothetical protein
MRFLFLSLAFMILGGTVGCASNRGGPPLLTPTDSVSIALSATPDALKIRPRMASGKSVGVLMGGSYGILSCIAGGAELDESDSGAGLLMGLLASPFCGIYGGFMGAAEARPASEVHTNVDSLGQILSTNNYPDLLLTPVGASLQTSLFVPVAAAAKQELKVTLTDFRLSGTGINPPLRLRATTHLCLQYKSTGETIDLGNVQATSRSYRLNEWANGGEYLLQYETNTIASALATKIGIALNKGVKHRKPCEQEHAS